MVMISAEINFYLIKSKEVNSSAKCTALTY